MKFIYLCLLLLLLIINSFERTQSLSVDEECGVLNVDLIYNRTPDAASEEFPWTALIIKSKMNKEEYACKGVLISNRAVLVPNYCIQSETDMLVSIDLGFINPADRQNCTEDSKCPASQRYDIEEIILNPNYMKENLLGNIAMLRLDKDVTYGRYIQPLCLPAAAATQNELITKHLYVAGYPYGPHKIKKMKSFVQIVHEERCEQKYYYKILSEHICGLIEYKLPFATGAVLMDVQVENGIPKKFYLVGLLTDYNADSNDIPWVFINVAPYLDWIKRNL